MAPVVRGSNTDSSNLDEHSAPIPRAASVSKPTPKPRPRSLIVEKDTSNKEPKVVETAEKPVAPPRIKSKPLREDSDTGAQENRSTKAPKPELPDRPDLNPAPPVKPKRKPVCNEPPPVERPVSPSLSDSESVAVTLTTNAGDVVDSNALDILTGPDEIKSSSEVGPSKGEAKKAGPPPIPRRDDLD